MKSVYLDFETYSELDIKGVGAYKYSTHPSTLVLCMGYAIGDGEALVWTPDLGVGPLEELFTAINSGYAVVAHNAMFDRCIYQNICCEKLSFPYISPRYWRCTAARISQLGIPSSLAFASSFYDLGNKKNRDGVELVDLFCKPKSNGRVLPASKPNEFTKLLEYCKQDVLALRDLDSKAPTFQANELDVWHLDQEINIRGICVDIPLVNAAIKSGMRAEEKLLSEASELIPGISRPTQVSKLLEEVHKYIPDVKSLTIKTVHELKSDTRLPENVRKMLSIRTAIAKTSTAKYPKILNMVGEGNRIRDCYKYYGAITGRWAGRGVQPQNLPRGIPRRLQAEKIKELMDGNTKPESVLELTSGLIRSVFVAQAGYTMFAADYSNIEARVLAWIAGEEDLLYAFNTGGGVYEKMAAAIYGVDANSIKKDSLEREVGKFTELGCGYQMGAARFKLEADRRGLVLSEEFCEKIVQTYRATHPKIRMLWNNQETLAKLAVTSGRDTSGNGVTWCVREDFLFCVLPSGRRLAYYKPKVNADLHTSNTGQLRLTYCTFVPNAKDANDPAYQGRKSLYGGIIVENIIQGISRDITANGMLNASAIGYNILMHSHDEVIAEAYGDIDLDKKLAAFIDALTRKPHWMKTAPIKLVAEGWFGDRYGK